MRAADLDGDGVSELVTVDRRDGALVVVHGGERHVSRFPAATSASAIELADLGDDGILDALVGRRPRRRRPRRPRPGPTTPRA